MNLFKSSVVIALIASSYLGAMDETKEQEIKKFTVNICKQHFIVLEKMNSLESIFDNKELFEENFKIAKTDFREAKRAHRGELFKLLGEDLFYEFDSKYDAFIGPFIFSNMNLLENEKEFELDYIQFVFLFLKKQYPELITGYIEDYANPEK